MSASQAPETCSSLNSAEYRPSTTTAADGISASRCIWNASVPSEREDARFSRVLRSTLAIGSPSATTA